MVESYLQRVRSEINQLYLNKHIAHNLTPQEIEALKNLAQDTNLIIKKADKGSSIVLEDKEKYIKDGQEHLSDKQIYEKVNSDPTLQLAKA